MFSKTSGVPPLEAKELGLESPSANLEHSSSTTEDLSSSAFDLWDDMTAQDDLTAREIHQLHSPHPPDIFCSSVDFFFDRAASDRLSEQAILRTLCWNPGPKRVSLGTIRNHIARPWHIVASQESIKFLEDDGIENQAHVAHFHGCATVFNKDTFEPDLRVKSIYVPKVQAYCSIWAKEVVITRACFRRIPCDGKSSFAIMSLQCHTAVAPPPPSLQKKAASHKTSS